MFVNETSNHDEREDETTADGVYDIASQLQREYEVAVMRELRGEGTTIRR